MGALCAPGVHAPRLFGRSLSCIAHPTSFPLVAGKSDLQVRGVGDHALSFVARRTCASTALIMRTYVCVFCAPGALRAGSSLRRSGFGSL